MPDHQPISADVRSAATTPAGNLAAGCRAAIGLSVLVGLTAACRWLQVTFHLRLPGTVIGLAVLAVLLLVLKRASRPLSYQVDLHLEPVAKTLLRYMGLLFVPAGVGVITQADVLRSEGWAIALAVLGSTILGIIATGWVAQRFANSRGAR